MSSFLSPTKLRELCSQYNLSPSKKYGQNYLISDAPIRKMIEASDLKKTDTVVEIGPGFGVLTFALAEKAQKVIAFEIERRLEEYWEEKQKEYNNIEIVWGNAIRQLTINNSQLTGSYKVVANLPYQITSNVLRTLLELPHTPQSITVMVQKEVAERICAKPGDMSLLAVSVQYFGEPRIIAKVGKGNFWPEPKVDSAVLYIKTSKHQNTKTIFSDQEFFRVVRAGFANKRKQLWRNLSAGLGLDSSQVKEVLYDVVKNEKVRAEELSVVEWKEVVKRLGHVF